MLKFRTAAGRAQYNSKRPPNYLGQKFQRPIWFFILILGVGIWIFRGGDPGRWADLFSMGKKSGTQDAADNRIAADTLALAPGEVQAPAAAEPNQPVAEKRLFGKVDPQLFTDLEDDATYRRDEEDGFFRLLRVLDEADERDIEVASIGEKTFRQLSEQTKEYRGEVIDVAGVVHRLIPQKANANLHGIEKFYEVWVIPHGTKVPLVFVCLDLPDNYKAGEMGQKIRASGFFYKRLGYAGAPDPKKPDEPVFRSSPLVLAKTLRVESPSEMAKVAAAGEEAVANVPGLPAGIPVKWVLPLLGMGMVLMIFLAVWAYRLSRTSVTSGGPFVGRARRAAEEARAAQNLNELKIEP
ncbi:MAG: hypothetical protein QM775_09155 [Pirellulales bacterium]